eukprot:TRINITY_DN23000_c0_g1_i1.p1 TRINITY_DN23000_c0_g1~~TRINITY_DN23000_c0_g1_i1.p1  ORF type:complete len:257 (+),score=35.20 TRINITY_DN23000_c0_g1_i1:46-771(+)
MTPRWLRSFGRCFSCSSNVFQLDRISSTLSAVPRQKLKPGVARGGGASVLVPLCIDAQDRAAVLLTVRSAGLRSHAGEICFPGGRADLGDTDLASTALREANEELGLARADVRLLGELRPVLSKGGVAVTSVVGYVGKLDVATLTPNEEVAAAFTVPIDHLLRPETLVFYDITVPRATFPRKVPAFRLTPAQAATLPCSSKQERPPGAPLEEVSVWGLTGFILHELLFNVLQLHKEHENAD